MATAGWLMIFFCLELAFMSWATDAHEGGGVASSVEITHKDYCSHTRYPDLCMDTLLNTQGLLVHGNLEIDLVSLLVERTRDETMQTTTIGVSASSNHTLKSLESPRTQEAIEYCDGLMQMSLKRLNQSLTALKASPKESKQDIQTWLSAVLTFQDGCKDSVNEYSGPVVSQISSKMDHLSMLASNALALANRIHGGSPAGTNRRLASKEGVFPNWVSSKDRKLLLSTAIQADAVVALDGSGNYTSVSEALESLAGTGGRSVIFMKAGVYHEKFSVNQDGVMLVGEGKDSTIISYGGSVGGGSSMPGSATVVVTGDNFVAKDIGFENSAGSGGHQALALRIASDHAALYRCSLRGYQDTLYAYALRQFYRECDIYGSIDFIFGNAAAVFQSCNILFRKPHSGGYNTIMANGRTDPGQNTGFTAQNCKIGASSELYPSRNSVKSYLGRPWKQYSRAVVMQSSIDDSIQSSGWVPWSGGFALKTLYFAEYLNGGPGAGTSDRVQWPGFHVLDSTEASKFTVANFISGTSWLPSTGIIYDPGL